MPACLAKSCAMPNSYAKEKKGGGAGVGRDGMGQALEGRGRGRRPRVPKGVGQSGRK